VDLTEKTAVSADPGQREDPARLIEWTGERCVPWADDVQVVYEHLHRYHFAAQVVAGKRVLDLASGEGFGAAILSDHAAEVVGVDVDPQTVEHSRRTYSRPNLSFMEGSMLDRGTLPDGRFDVVTCFEAIEHVADHDGLLDAIQSLLEKDGLLLLSTPDRDVYSNVSGRANPFHVRELSRPELLELLRSRFAHVQLWGQAAMTGSVMFPLEGTSTGSQLVTVDGDDSDWHQSSPSRPAYLFAVASARTIPPLPAVSTLEDDALRLVHDAVRARSDAETAKQELARRHAVLEEQQALLQEQLAFSDAAAHRLKAEYDLIRSTRGWRVLSAYRRVRARARVVVRDPSRAAAAGGRAVARLRSIVPGGSSVNGRSRRHVDVAGLAFPGVDAPRVSIVIPTYNGYEITTRCLAAIRHNTMGSFEIIVVDDASSDGTSDRLGAVAGLRVVRNATNLGFTESVIAGAEAARGELLLFLNNDTEVQPGWLEALIDAMEADPAVGAAGSKLLFPDGRLQEAGSIIWNDGTGANLGYGADPNLPQYNYVRDVDYCSAAALVVRRSAYDEVGGFDRTFTPGYYEDTDLCFAIRARGHRVIYVPRSVVVHDHGASFGSEEGRKAVGTFTKEAMHVNRHRFVAKWMDELDDHWPSGTADGLLGGRRDRRVRVLVCDHQVPAHDRDSGSLRMTWIIRLLVQAGCAVSLLPLNGAATQPYTGEFQQMGVEVLHGVHDRLRLLQSRSGMYDLALLSRPSVAHGLLDEVRAASPGTFVVYDTVDLHHIREARRLRLEGEEPDSDFVEVRGVERLLIRRSDLVATVSAEEEKVVQAFVHGTATVVLPNVHGPVVGDLPGFDERSDLLFIGSYLHPPNIDAMLWFVQEVMPLVTARVPAHLTILGQEPPDEVRRLAGPDVTVTGYVPSVDEYFRRARVFVAPLRYGAGVKGKVGQAMTYGLPIVTTQIGAEGMGIVDGIHALVRDDPAAFAEAVVDLLASAELWNRIAAGSCELVRQYSPEAMAARLREMLNLATSRSPR
jgi:GT2 family glycosyltransferase/SAM-dependent methyltransferase